MTFSCLRRILVQSSVLRSQKLFPNFAALQTKHSSVIKSWIIGASSFTTSADIYQNTFKMSGHSEIKVVEFNNVSIKVLPANGDNFMYLIIDKESQQAFVVDPCDPALVLTEVENANVSLEGVLTTHHHWDHAGGNAKLAELFKKKNGKDLRVFGGDDRIEALTNKVGHGDSLTLGSLSLECLHTPCHTGGHICYYVKKSDPTQNPLVFTGDTLFIAGCGRFFEGTADQMHEALIQKLGKLPDDTMVFCGHEYTVNNLKFALSIEPNNKTMLEKMNWAFGQRENSTPTVPSTIGEEKMINPFMRCIVPEVQDKLKVTDAISCMGMLRAKKDKF